MDLVASQPSRPGSSRAKSAADRRRCHPGPMATACRRGLRDSSEDKGVSNVGAAARTQSAVGMLTPIAASVPSSAGVTATSAELSARKSLPIRSPGRSGTSWLTATTAAAGPASATASRTGLATSTAYTGVPGQVSAPTSATAASSPPTTATATSTRSSAVSTSYVSSARARRHASGERPGGAQVATDGTTSTTTRRSPALTARQPSRRVAGPDRSTGRRRRPRPDSASAELRHGSACGLSQRGGTFPQRLALPQTNQQPNQQPNYLAGQNAEDEDDE